MSNKEYRIDGRDPNAKGYVKEDRMANQHETDKIVEALESFGYKNVEDYKFHLFGRLDDVHGWYLFGISKEDDYREDFLILDDCLDVLEGPTYNKVVGLDDVMHYAWTEGSGDNIGTAYDAMQEWGVFRSITHKMSVMLDEHDVCVEGETAKWDATREEWRLSWNVIYNTDAGAEEQTEITIPACLDSREEADNQFAKAWADYLRTFDKGEEASQYQYDGVSDRGEAYEWADSKENAIARINKLLQGFVKFGLVEIDDEAKPDKDFVWVLTIRHKGENCPEVHKTLEGAIDGARNDFMKNDDVTESDWERVKVALEKHHFFFDEDYATEYDLTECPMCK